MKKFQQFQLVTEDHHQITARFFQPEPAAKAAILIAPAMGVQQKYYAAFAHWLSQQGFLVATLDYRGIGLSRSQSLRGFKADIFDWARLDCAALVKKISTTVDGRPIYWIGHSLGGQIFPLLPELAPITKMIAIASGSGFWRDAPRRLRQWSWFFWYLVVPVSLALCGYFPGTRLRKVGDLPRDVMAQWRRWCLHPEYAVGVEGAQIRQLYAQVRIPVTSLSFTDDEFMSAQNVTALYDFYTAAQKTMKRISPEDVAVERIGHFGFFRPQFRDTLWQKYLLPELS